MLKYGRFISFEGGEGAGKSTQLNLLSADLQRNGISVHKTREPGGSVGAEEIRNLLVVGDAGRWDSMSEALLHFAARRDHVQNCIRPTLKSGKWVLSDRFVDSTLAYQGNGYGLGFEKIRELQTLAIGEFIPDLTLILDLPVSEAFSRVASRSAEKSRYECFDVNFHERVRMGYHEIAAAQPTRCVIINASNDVNSVQEEIRNIIVKRFKIDS